MGFGSLADVIANNAKLGLPIPDAPGADISTDPSADSGDVPVVQDDGTYVLESLSAVTFPGLTATVAELNFSDGVTSSIQGQIDALPTDAELDLKADANNPSLTGTKSLDNGVFRVLVDTVTIISGLANGNTIIFNDDADVDIPVGSITTVNGETYTVTSFARNAGFNRSVTVTPNIVTAIPASSEITFLHDIDINNINQEQQDGANATRYPLFIGSDVLPGDGNIAREVPRFSSDYRYNPATRVLSVGVLAGTGEVRVGTATTSTDNDNTLTTKGYVDATAGITVVNANTDVPANPAPGQRMYVQTGFNFDQFFAVENAAGTQLELTSANATNNDPTFGTITQMTANYDVADITVPATVPGQTGDYATVKEDRNLALQANVELFTNADGTTSYIHGANDNRARIFWFLGDTTGLTDEPMFFRQNTAFTVGFYTFINAALGWIQE